MAGKVKPIPEDYHTITPYLAIKGAAEAIDFYKKAFGAKELMRMPGPDGKIGHAEIKIGDSPVMLADEYPDLSFRSPGSLGGSTVHLLIYVEDADAVTKHAVQLGGKLVRPVENKFYGDRSGTIEDPFGHTWHISTHVEDVAPDEMERRAAAEQMAKAGA